MVTTTQIHTCIKCGHTGEDVTEQDYYNPQTDKDTTEYLCDDPETCLDRIGFYPRNK